MKKSKVAEKPPPKKPHPYIARCKALATKPQKKSNHKPDEILNLVKKALEKMTASKQKALLALAAAATAVAAAATALAEPDEAGGTLSPGVNQDAAPKATPPPKKAATVAKVEACPAAVTGPNTTTPRKCIKAMPHGAGEHEFPPEATPVVAKVTPVVAEGEVPMFDKVVTAFKEYCGVFTRAEGVKVLAKFLPPGGKALADVPEDKLPDMLAALTA